MEFKVNAIPLVYGDIDPGEEMRELWLPYV